MIVLFQGLFHLAIAMYERVLRFFETSKEQKRKVPSQYLLCRETAYNLSLIYKQRCVFGHELLGLDDSVLTFVCEPLLIFFYSYI